MRYYDPANHRLVYVDRKASPDFWDANWNGFSLTREHLMQTPDSQWAQVTREYLSPEDGMILEGGCGLGTHVAALHQQGYRVVGIDFASKTVNKLNEIAPELDIRLGDVRHLDLPDACLAGYWSLGVIEHFYEGYHEIADEMHRTLAPGGILFLAFPYMNPLRTGKAKLGSFAKWKEQNVDAFYQFALPSRPVLEDFTRRGFILVASRPVLGRQGVAEEFPKFTRRMERWYKRKDCGILSRAARQFFHRVNLLLQARCGYSMLLVLKKQEGPVPDTAT